MTLTDRAEEILETLWIEIVEREKDACDVSILKDDITIKELKESGLVKLKDYQLRLTRKGREEARSCIRRHRLAERMFVDVLDLKGLGHPKTCPHGKPIPPGDCCKELAKTPKKVNIPLTELKVNRKARVAYLQTHNRQKLQKIIAMGALPKTEITLLQKFPSYVFKIARSQFAVDKELASCIYVSAGKTR
jgi:DtxR family Mn-dependent transcriptional regulator